MNAYELAEELEGWSDDWLSSGNKKNVFKKHANMLRQQAALIEYYEVRDDSNKKIIADLVKEVKEFHKIAQVMAMKESDARKELQNYEERHGIK